MHGTRHNGSLMQGADGTIYSYNTHFPLVVKASGYCFINDAYYSNSTRRHQSWAKQASNGLPFDYRFSKYSPIEKGWYIYIQSALRNELKDLKNKIQDLSPRAFAKKRDFLFRQSELTESLYKLLRK